MNTSRPSRPVASMARTRFQAGLGAIAAIVVVVLLASITAAVVRLTWTQQVSSAQDIMGAKGFQAAHAGTEWGMYQALRGSWANAACAGSSQTLDLRSAMGFMVTVSCSSQATPYNEGHDAAGANQQVRLYVIDAVACTTNSTCPDNAGSSRPTYVERRRRVVVANVARDF